MSQNTRLGQTPSQTVGPYFAYGITPTQYGYPFDSIAGPVLADETVPGERIRIEGQIFDGQGVAIADAIVEFWQADSTGTFARPGANAGFTGIGRVGTGSDPAMQFAIETVKPGSIGIGQAPHINVIVQMRGLLNHLFTRIYFPENAEGNATDPVLSEVPQERRNLLVARAMSSGVYRFDIHMQGENETPFFDF
ncbi:PcaH Protocatechuate 3,4-dioxygenase beta subunit [Rhabdaerophilaceae bacterium]